MILAWRIPLSQLQMRKKTVGVEFMPTGVQAMVFLPSIFPAPELSCHCLAACPKTALSTFTCHTQVEYVVIVNCVC